ncbi:MAG: hypothetical protein P4L31_08265 [Candidatus Babeliales bacterium]|nr:hypothetical protein [Candidatus Babeliales bacterium]
MKHSPIFYVLYDGINNSVFLGQVLHPIIKKLQSDPDQKIYIISFEQSLAAAHATAQKIPSYKNLEIIIRKKNTYLGSINIWYAAHQLKKLLKNFSSYELIARGPLAGMICKYAMNKNCIFLTIQARGLLAQEYVYAQSENNTKKRVPPSLVKFRTWQLASIEKKAYKKTYSKTPITIQAVSRALKEYLITTFNADRENITIAYEDIPHVITQEKLAIWKNDIRNELGIDTNAKVYCYNGSLKPWQCPEKVIEFFKNQLSENEHAFLLILTQDVYEFKQLLAHSNIDEKQYQVMNVAYDDIYRYLAACDVGILFRESHIVNWVSRPTKALEYQAVNLCIAHNNTVAWLVQKS